MAKIRTLKGLARDVADHCSGPFSWLHPHVGEFASELKLDRLTVDLLQSPAVAGSHVPEPLRLASRAAQVWFAEHLKAYGFAPSDLHSAEVTFSAFGSTPYIFGTESEIITTSGLRFSAKSGLPPN